MADDGMLMNWEIPDVPFSAKSSFQGGRWKDRLAAKKVAQHHLSKANRPAPPNREIFQEKRHDTAVEEYIGPGSAPRPPKRQRTDDIGPRTNWNSQTAAVVAGKLPPGSISAAAPSKSIKFGDDRPQHTKQESTRPAFVSGKLPPGSIKFGEKGGALRKRTSFQDFESGKLPQGGGVSAERERVKGTRSAGHVSSLFSFNPASKTTFEDAEDEAEPTKPTNAPLTEEMATFTNLGLSVRLAAHLSTKMEMKAPTAIQKATITQLTTDDSDAFIQAQTGSGKTLAYLLPIVERIMSLSKDGAKVNRNSGLFAIILAPTRELCKQIFTVLEKLLRCAPWIVATTVIGGESKQSEKARLRKGVNILVATPGRLADHLDNTEVLKVNTVRWLVLDEGDRLMELGFEDEIKNIVDRISRRALAKGFDGDLNLDALPSRRVTMLCSATMKMTVQRLGEISLTDAVHIQAEASDDAGNEGGDKTDEKAFSAPAQLKQGYAIVPAKLRLVTLIAVLKRAFARRGSVMKAIVFISCADSVDFHFLLLSRELTQPEDPKDAIAVSELPKSDLTKDTVAHATALSSSSNSVVLHKLHGSLPQNVRTATLKSFTDSKDTSVMVCTDVASRGLDLPNVDYIVEYDPPFSAEDHLHRVGRTARAGREGRALIFLLPGEEEEYISVLASSYSDGKRSLSHHAAPELLQKGLGGVGDEWEARATELQLDAERWVLDGPRPLEMARRGFQSHLRAYATHVAPERHIFNMQTLHLGHLAKAFALRDKPGSIRVPGARPAKMTPADRSVAARKAARRLRDGEGPDDSLSTEGERERKKRKEERDGISHVDADDVAKRMRRKMREHMAVASEFNIG